MRNVTYIVLFVNDHKIIFFPRSLLRFSYPMWNSIPIAVNVIPTESVSNKLCVMDMRLRTTCYFYNFCSTSIGFDEESTYLERNNSRLRLRFVASS